MIDAREASQRIASLLRNERSCLAEFLVALAAFDAERGWQTLGYASLFQYLERELRLTSSAAAGRQTAVRLIRQLPAVVQPIRDGRICMSVVYEVAKVVTPANADELLPRFFGLSKRAAEELVATLRPAETVPVREVVTAVTSRNLGSDPTAVAIDRQEAHRQRDGEPSYAVPERTPPAESERVVSPAVQLISAKPRDGVEVLTSTLRRLHLTVSAHFLGKLEAAKDAVSHAIPDRDPEAVISAALDLLLERAAKRRGLVKKPRPAPAPPSNDPHRIPAAVAREVWRRDGEKCAYPLGGSVCGSTVRLQLDHVLPVALGGLPSVDNLRVCCALHNRLAARKALGDALVDRFTSSRG